MGWEYESKAQMSNLLLQNVEALAFYENAVNAICAGTDDVDCPKKPYATLEKAALHKTESAYFFFVAKQQI